MGCVKTQLESQPIFKDLNAETAESSAKVAEESLLLRSFANPLGVLCVKIMDSYFTS
jgi:hypothetical protein